MRRIRTIYIYVVLGWVRPIVEPGDVLGFEIFLGASWRCESGSRAVHPSFYQPCHSLFMTVIEFGEDGYYWDL